MELQVKIAQEGPGLDVIDREGGWISPNCSKEFAAFAIAVAARGVPSLEEVTGLWNWSRRIIDDVLLKDNFDRIRPTAERYRRDVTEAGSEE